MEGPVVTSCGTGVTACILALVFILFSLCAADASQL